VCRGIAALHNVDWSALGRWVYCSNQWPLMSALGQERTSPVQLAMSALPPNADIERHNWIDLPFQIYRVSGRCGTE